MIDSMFQQIFQGFKHVFIWHKGLIMQSNNFANCSLGKPIIEITGLAQLFSFLAKNFSIIYFDFLSFY